GPYDERKLNLELEVLMISVCIELDFEDQLDTDTLICKVFIKKSVREESLTTYAQGLHQEISERRITKEDKESEFGSLCIYNIKMHNQERQVH
ncbi:unnamed protein product, partial [Brassica rapa]